ncbi:Protein PBDC1 [Camelus dromedarius]|uniref:Protein PBDC1 n=1 Tax=Camelus dromedarius TaxID=9838 RepID=A0A5N4C1E6_CAMDR|nr:Protein PBDC1 [Camelus dromedarius]
MEATVNDEPPDIEMAWAMRAMQHAKSTMTPELTKVDDQIYSEFREFEKLRIDVLDPEELKSESAKECSDKKKEKGANMERQELTVEEKKRKDQKKEKKRKLTKEEKKRKPKRNQQKW